MSRIEGGRMLVTSRPDPVLAGSVLGYRGFRIGVTGPRSRLVVPDGVVKVMFGLHEPIRIVDAVDGRARAHASSMFCGLRTTASIGEHTGMLYGITAMMTPLAAYRIFAMPMGEAANAPIDLEDLLGPGARILLHRLGEAPGWDARFGLLDRWFADRLFAGPDHRAEVARAWRLLARTKGRMTVKDLAADTGLSVRHLQRRFQEQIGLSPKALAGVLRFQHALRLADRGMSWSQVASVAGYYDQPHLDHTFRGMIGLTPSGFLSARAAARRGEPRDFLPDRVTGVLLRR